MIFLENNFETRSMHAYSGDTLVREPRGDTARESSKSESEGMNLSLDSTYTHSARVVIA